MEIRAASSRGMRKLLRVLDVFMITIVLMTSQGQNNTCIYQIIYFKYAKLLYANYKSIKLHKVQPPFYAQRCGCSHGRQSPRVGICGQASQDLLTQVVPELHFEKCCLRKIVVLATPALVRASCQGPSLSVSLFCWVDRTHLTGT